MLLEFLKKVYLSWKHIRNSTLCYWNGVYAGDADLVLSSGHSSTGDYRAARHAIVHSDNPWADSEQKLNGRDDWHALHREADSRTVRIAGMDSELGPRRLIAQSPNAMGLLAHVGHEILTTGMRHWDLLEADQGYCGEAVVSDTGEIRYQFGRGAIEVESDALSFFAGHSTGTELGGRLRTQRAPLGFALLALDGCARPASRHLLISTMGRCGNSNQRWIGRVLIERGGPPIVYEDLRGSYHLETEASAIVCYALGDSGERLGTQPVVAVPGGFEIELEGHVHYEIVALDEDADT